MSNDLFSRGKKVYVAAPYSAPTVADRAANVELACKAARKVMAFGYSPFVPTLSHYIAPQNDLFSYERWMDWCLLWLKDCDVLLVTGLSKGVRIEIDFAIKNAIPIVWSLDQLRWRHEQEQLRASVQERQAEPEGADGPDRHAGRAEDAVQALQDEEPLDGTEEAEVGQVIEVGPDLATPIGPSLFRPRTVREPRPFA